MSPLRNYSATVTPVQQPDGWQVSIEISDGACVFIDRRDVDALRFETREAAVAAGWRIAEQLIRDRGTSNGGVRVAD